MNNFIVYVEYASWYFHAQLNIGPNGSAVNTCFPTLLLFITLAYFPMPLWPEINVFQPRCMLYKTDIDYAYTEQSTRLNVNGMVRDVPYSGEFMLACL